jgi:2-polyprenyl-3-methyl-5-hydroxy-6-metoxy-1,4-benzoquinol methylase
MNLDTRALVTKAYDIVFHRHTGVSEEQYWNEFFSSKLQHYRESQTSDWDDWGEARYYARLHTVLQQTTGVNTFADRRVLELGCGSGMSSLLMAREGAHVTLLDRSESALAVAEFHYEALQAKGEFLGKVDFITGDFFEFHPSQQFDLVHNHGVIEHWSDNEIHAILHQMIQCTRPQGTVLCSVPNFFSPDTLSIWGTHGKGSERFIPRSELAALMTAAGLDEVQTASSTTVYPAWVPKSIVESTNDLEAWLGERLGLGFLHIAVGIAPAQ